MPSSGESSNLPSVSLGYIGGSTCHRETTLPRGGMPRTNTSEPALKRNRQRRGSSCWVWRTSPRQALAAARIASKRARSQWSLGYSTMARSALLPAHLKLLQEGGLSQDPPVQAEWSIAAAYADIRDARAPDITGVDCREACQANGVRSPVLSATPTSTSTSTGRPRKPPVPNPSAVHSLPASTKCTHANELTP